MKRIILIVDDDDDIREVATLALEMTTDWTVITGTSGAEAVQRAVEFSPNAILLDVMMPGTDGPTALAQLKADPRTRDIPVVFLTAKVREADQSRLRSLPAAGVLGKPFDPMVLSSQLAAILGW